MSAALHALRVRLQRLSLSQLATLSERDQVPALAREVVLEEMARRRDAPSTLAGAWDVITHSPAGTPAHLDRDQLRPVAVVRVRSRLASLQARETARAIDAPVRRRRAPQLPMKRGGYLWVPASGLVLSLDEARDVLEAIRQLTS